MFLSKSISKFFIKFMLLTLSFFIFASCGIYKKTDARKVPVSGIERSKKILKKEEGSGFSTLIKIEGVVYLILLLQTLCGELLSNY